MKKAVLTLITLIVSSTVLANSPAKPVDIEQTTNFVVTPSIGYRYDVFKWAIPDDVFPQNKLSELVWKNRIIQPSVKFEIEPKQNQFSFLVQTKYGYILKNQSKSWDHDWDHTRNRTGNVTSKLRSTSKSQTTGNILDLSGAVGYSLDLFKDSLLTFYVGYDYTDYKNKNYGDRQLVFKRKLDYFSSGGLFQKYNFKTQTPWFGFSVKTPITDKFQIVPTIKFYSFKYIGKGYWIHRPDFKQNPSFKQKAKGIGLGFDMDLLYKYNDNLNFKINLETKKLKIKTGNEQIFYNSQAFGGERIGTGKLFSLSFISSSISAGFDYKL